MNVLIVVDMQNDFISGALGSAQAQAIEPAVVETILNFDGAIYFTLDTHQENYLETQEGRRLPTAHCIAGTEGWTPSAAVWMALMVTSSMVSSRSVAEMMPAVTEPCTLPIGLPMATASSPISS